MLSAGTLEPVFVPQVHDPEQKAEVHWGEAELVLAGQRRTSRPSASSGGVFAVIRYDNLRWGSPRCCAAGGGLSLVPLFLLALVPKEVHR